MRAVLYAKPKQNRLTASAAVEAMPRETLLARHYHMQLTSLCQLPFCCVRPVLVLSLSRENHCCRRREVQVPSVEHPPQPQEPEFKIHRATGAEKRVVASSSSWPPLLLECSIIFSIKTMFRTLIWDLGRSLPSLGPDSQIPRFPKYNFTAQGDRSTSTQE